MSVLFCKSGCPPTEEESLDDSVRPLPRIPERGDVLHGCRACAALLEARREAAVFFLAEVGARIWR